MTTTASRRSRVRASATLLPEPVLVDLGRSRVAGPPTEDPARHLDRFGPRPPGDAGLLQTADEVALTGHGGAHFPAAGKWRVALESGGAAVVVANAAEGEPLSAKDFALLHARPQLVLDGLVTVAELTGADRCVVWVNAGPAARAVTDALAVRADPLPVTVVEAPPGYLAGQSAAVARGLGGGPAIPVHRPAPGTARPRRPTLVHNVETLARVALLARGLPPGGPLVTVLGTEGLRVHETVDDAPLSELVPGAPQALLTGGFGGTWHRWDDVAHRPVGDLSGRGRRELGAGVLAPIGHDACGLRETAAVLGFLAASSARQCGPCTFGTAALAEAMARLARGARSRRDHVLDIAGEVDGRGACRLPDGAASLARSALAVFADDAARHARRSPCRARRLTIPVPVPARVQR